MESPLTLSVCLLLVVICSCSWKTDAQSLPTDSSTCQVEYTEQPPEQLLCNPYINAELRLECKVTAAAQLNQIPRLIWYRSRPVQQQQSQRVVQPDRSSSSSSSSLSSSRSKRNTQWITERLESTQTGVTIQQQTLGRRVRSRLRFNNIDGLDSGEYWCSIEINGQQGGGEIIPSDTVYLMEPTSYSQLSACATSGALSKVQRKCALSSAVVTTDSKTTTSTPVNPDAMSTRSLTVTSETEKPTSAATDGGSSTSSLPNSTAEKATGVTNGETAAPFDNKEVATTTTTATETLNNPGGSDSNGPVSEEDNGSGSISPNVLLELYIAVAILVIFGVIIVILVPVAVCMCLRKRKNSRIEGTRRARQNLELASARCNVQTSSSQSTTAASDYLVPQPSWRSRKGQVEPVDCQGADILQRSYETCTLGYSHEYEDIMDVIEGGATHLHDIVCASSTSGSPTSDVPLPDDLEEGAGDGHRITAYVNNDPMLMKRNEAYRLFSTETLRRHAYCNDVTVPHPLNCLHTQTEQSNLE